MLREPPLRVAAHRVVAAGIAFHPQPLEQAREAETLALGLGQFLGQQGVQARDVPIELRAGLVLTLVGEGGLVGAQRLTHDLAGQTQLARDLPDAPVLAKQAPDLGDGLHDHHPRLAP
ncbi:MAG: hypothetical protein MIN69_14180 [Methylorubrum extorquens]|uniref:hypothetical protein n=1 Tax=Methylorubrum extorquens TaxID=408 RepID=UPI002FEDF610